MREGFLDDVFERKTKTSDKIVPALVKTGIAAGGGLVAGRIDTIASEQWPKSTVAGPFLVALISVALRILADGGSALERVGQELALTLQGKWPLSCVNPTVLSKGALRRWQPYSMERGPNS